MILCIGSLADKTFLYTIRRMTKLNVDIKFIDLAYLVLYGEIYFSKTNPLNSFFLIDNEVINVGGFQSFYIRLMDIIEAAPSDKLKEKATITFQILRNLFSIIQAPVINPLNNDFSNFSKPMHAQFLNSISGIKIPRTCLTNQPNKAIAFYNSCSHKVIFKGCSSLKTTVKMLDKITIEEIGQIKNCPTLFQEYIKGPDIRVHVVHDICFAEEISSNEVDYRFEKNNIYKQIMLPKEIEKACIKISNYLKTPLLGIDFKRSKNNQWYLLEANNQPCYQGYDKRANYDISNALIHYLISKNKHHEKSKNSKPVFN